MEIPNLFSGLTTLLYSLAHAVSINIIVFFDVPSSVRSGLQAMQSVVNRFPQPQKSFSSYFSTIFLRSQFVVQHYVSSQSSPISTVHFTASTFKVLLCRVTYTYQLFLHSVPTSFLHPDRRWCVVSLCSPSNLHLSYSTNHLIFFHDLISCWQILTIFSWDQCYISTCQSLLQYIALLFHFAVPSLTNFVVYSFFVLYSRPFLVFSILLPIQSNFLRQ